MVYDVDDPIGKEFKKKLFATDFDDDGFISITDLKASLKALTKSELTPEEHQQIAEKV